MNNSFDRNMNANVAENFQISRARVIPTKNKWKSWRVNVFAYLFVSLLLFLGSSEGARMAGWWTTSGNLTVTGETVKAKGANPAEIRGFMTIQEVLAAYNLTWEEMSGQFNIPADTSLSSPLNTLEKGAPDFSVTKLRTWLTERATK